MEKYQVVEECSCSLQLLGEYNSREDAEEAAAILESSGLRCKIRKTEKEDLINDAKN